MLLKVYLYPTATTEHTRTRTGATPTEFGLLPLEVSPLTDTRQASSRVSAVRWICTLAVLIDTGIFSHNFWKLSHGFVEFSALASTTHETRAPYSVSAQENSLRTPRYDT